MFFCFNLDLLCFSVSVLGVYNYTTADFVRGDVYNTIRTYLYVGSSKSFKHAKWDANSSGEKKTLIK